MGHTCVMSTAEASHMAQIVADHAETLKAAGFGSAGITSTGRLRMGSCTSSASGKRRRNHRRGRRFRDSVNGSTGRSAWTLARTSPK